MCVSEATSIPSSNQLLAALPAEEYQRFLPLLEVVPLQMRQVLYEPNVPVQFVYFPIRGFVSLLVILQQHPIEVAVVGNEGMVGLSVFLNVDRTLGKAVVQIPGNAFRMEIEMFKRELQSSSTLYQLLLYYTQSRINQMAQITVCNRLHSIQQRCCRCLLMIQDRMKTDQFPLTQEILAQMLGVRRASISEVASTIQRQGLIQYHRGQITILNRTGLEDTACECYGAIGREFDRLFH